jgi:hypothetical protein
MNESDTDKENDMADVKFNHDVPLKIAPLIITNSYKMVGFCQNCFDKTEFTIKKGKSFDHIEDNTPCPNCGCKTLVRDYAELVR